MLHAPAQHNSIHTLYIRVHTHICIHIHSCMYISPCFVTPFPSHRHATTDARLTQSHLYHYNLLNARPLLDVLLCSLE